MSLFSKLFYRDTTSIQDKVNEDVEGVGGEQVVISNTNETTNEEK